MPADVFPPPAASLTCRKRGQHHPAVERLGAAIVVLQQHRVCVPDFAGVKCRLHFQELWEEVELPFFFSTSSLFLFVSDIGSLTAAKSRVFSRIKAFLFLGSDQDFLTCAFEIWTRSWKSVQVTPWWQGGVVREPL